MMRYPTPWQVAEIVCDVMGGSHWEAVMSGHRGSPRTADLRAVSWKVWREMHKGEVPCFTKTAEVWGRDRRNIARGLQRIAQRGLPNRTQQKEIMRRLRAD